MPNNRIDHQGPHRTAFEKNKKRVMATQTICGICGKPVDKTLKYPDPMAPCVDHIIPLAKGGHPSDMDNLQLAHLVCNRAKSDKLVVQVAQTLTDEQVVSNRLLPQHNDWSKYKSSKGA